MMQPLAFISLDWLGPVMKIEVFIFRVFPDSPVPNDESLAFHQFYFVSAVGAGVSVAYAHKCIIY